MMSALEQWPLQRAVIAGGVGTVRLLTEGISGSSPGESSTPAGRERRLRNAEAMRALLISSKPFPSLD